MYVTQSFLPLLRAGRGRVVNVSAPTARIPAPFFAPIAASKAALESMSDALRLELAAWNIPVIVVEPGGTQTEIFAKAEQTARDTLDRADPLRAALYGPQLAAVAKAGTAMKLGPAADVAAGIVKAVAARRPKRRYLIGSGARAFGVLAQLPPALRERAVASAFGLAKAGRAAAGR
jgi:NAD(P)-dependent dehydrogenase (short-subunit alcohol dehydrogenase family)